MELTTKQEYLSEANNHRRFAAVLFYSAEQPQSKQMATALGMLKDDYPFRYYRVCLDNKLADVVSDWAPIKIRTSPSVVLFQGDQPVASIEGADPTRLVTLIAQLCNNQTTSVTSTAGELAPTDSHQAPTENQTGPSVSPSWKDDSSSIDQAALERRLQLLVKSAPVMLFMKGSKEEPFCHFSKQAVAILNSLDVDFSSFDVFSDPSVREGMKGFSKWPTFPQLYVNGNFIGGVDIMSELLQTGELKKLLTAENLQSRGSSSLNDYLRALIHQQPVMVFMKGSRQSPYCRFSRQLMQLFDAAGIVEFGTFDILENDAVREGLKAYSQWPTYPQVYVQGQLLGGVDIVKSIVDEGGPGALVDEVRRGMAKTATEKSN